jgi:hypothetical protein
MYVFNEAQIRHVRHSCNDLYCVHDALVVYHRVADDVVVDNDDTHQKAVCHRDVVDDDGDVQT